MSHFDELDITENICSEPETVDCFGGLARVYTYVKEARQMAKEKKGPKVLYFIAGNFFEHDKFVKLKRNDTIIEILNYLQPDFMVSLNV